MPLDTRGFAYPFRIDADTGRVSQASGEDKLRQNLHVVLGTRQGERPMVRDFGTRLQALVHDPNDEVLGNLVRDEIQTALLRWEPRVLVTGVEVRQHEGELTLWLTYLQVDRGGAAGQLRLPIG
jgi:phage baseplate assembly protein W